MASGFMSSVSRMFHGKGKGKRHRSDPGITKMKPGEEGTPPPLSIPPASAVSSVSKKRGRNKTAAGGEHISSATATSLFKKRDAGRSSEADENISPSATPSVVKKRDRHKATVADENRSPADPKTREQTKRRSPFFSSLRKKTRPLSCIASRPDSPTEGLENCGEGMLDYQRSEQGHVKGEREENKSASKITEKRQSREKKPRRPLSCIVQPPSPRLQQSVDHFPQFQPCDDNDTRAPSTARDTRMQTQYVRPPQKPRPVSCFVESTAQRSPPPYSRREPSSPLFMSSTDQHIPFKVGSPQRKPPSYLEASRRSPRVCNAPQSVPSVDSLTGYPGYSEQDQHQAVDRYSENQALIPHTPRQVQELLGSKEGLGRQESLGRQTDSRQQPVYPPAPRQSTPVTDICSSQQSGRCGDVNCYLNPCPYRPPAPPQPLSNCRYDLKAYFPPACPPRRAPRPQSACFLCEPQPCCVAARRATRPMSQCYLPDSGLSLASPPPGVNGQLHFTKMYQDSSFEAGQGNAIEQLSYSMPTSASCEVDEFKPASCTAVEIQPSVCFSSNTDMSSSSPPPPRPAKRTLAPRPKSTYVLLTESEASPMSSPVPSPRPRRFPLKKYRSADCLDQVDELDSLAVSPPPAKPLSHFMTSTSQAGVNKHDEIFTSAEMLEKLGQPRSGGSHQPRPMSCIISDSHKLRPVSCVVGGSGDESGYLSTGTLGGSGWLGGLSASTGDILEMLEGEEMSAADDEMSFERASSLRKAWSVCSLLRQDTIQDRSFTVMRRRRQKMKERRHTNQRSSSTETDEGVKTTTSSSSLVPQHGESATIAGIPLDGRLHVQESRGVVTRLHSTQMKAWQIRLRRKQMMKKKRSHERLGPRVETLV